MIHDKLPLRRFNVYANPVPRVLYDPVVEPGLSVRTVTAGLMRER